MNAAVDVPASQSTMRRSWMIRSGPPATAGSDVTLRRARPLAGPRRPTSRTSPTSRRCMACTRPSSHQCGLRPGPATSASLTPSRRWRRGLYAFSLPPLAVENLDGFLALREQEPSSHLQALADTAVATLDEFREPPDAAELARRRRHGLTEAEDAMLVRWGYPYVFHLWRFHITLSRRLDEAEMVKARRIAQDYLGEALAFRRRVSSIAVFTQREAAQPFLLAQRFPLAC